jgi:hypothetical protein
MGGHGKSTIFVSIVEVEIQPFLLSILDNTTINSATFLKERKGSSITRPVVVRDAPSSSFAAPQR